MKLPLLLAGLLALVVSTALAQEAERFKYADLPIDATTHLVTYTDVVRATGATKEQLCLRAKAWATSSFMDSERAPQMFDGAAGTYSCRGAVHLPYGTTYSMVLAIQAKDGSYRYTINQLFYAYNASSSDALSGTQAESVEHWATYKKKNLHYVDVRIHEVRQFLPELLASLHAAMSTEIPEATR
ncbi:DUF4468 domain-containing protein [Hymenobacter sp. RP-2-7]|uniref:DUF4468 domain-containing protein n=1 Tax=Hymenobacter polaris TaxID=2682546 RepID=A0A7Y0AFW0_9BACT|nr:DUF4468 domain-containing protein [Hymenobacter polaris]NML66437.1 DUF4468 domain-containing protein [Hymenobacter polaris]